MRLNAVHQVFDLRHESVELFVRSHIHPPEPFKELGQLGDDGVAKDFRFAILGATEPVGQMCDEMRQFGEECLLGRRALGTYIEVPAGAVVFFNGYLLHRSRKNRSSGYRRALVSHYCSAQSFLPWVSTNQEPPVAVAQADVRKVHLVCGADPHAARGYEEPQKDVWLRHYAGAERKPNPHDRPAKPSGKK